MSLHYPSLSYNSEDSEEFQPVLLDYYKNEFEKTEGDKNISNSFLLFKILTYCD